MDSFFCDTLSRMRTAEYKARDAERARFRYHNNAESRERKKEKMRIWAKNNPQKTIYKKLTPEQKERRRLWNKSPKRMEQKRLAQRRYRNSLKGKETDSRHRKNRKKSDSFKKRRLEYTKRWRTRNPQKAKAHNAVVNALKSGKLVKKPCEICGKIPTVAHHDDYSKPLEVRWLCRLCHIDIHCRPAYRLSKVS